MSQLSPDRVARSAIMKALAVALALPAISCGGGQAMQKTAAGYPATPSYRPATVADNTRRLAKEAPARDLFRLADDGDGTSANTGDDGAVNVTGTGTGGVLGPQGTPPPPPAGAGNQGAEPEQPAEDKNRGKGKLKQALVVEGSLTLNVKEVPEAAKTIREYIEKIDGRVTSEQLSGGERSWSGHLQLKLPPERVDEFLTWMAKQGDISDKHVHGTDVSRTLFDQQIALDNLQLTLNRMRKLLDKEGLDMKDVLAIEREMTRLRGEIERIKGEKRFLEYRVAMATLDVHLRRKEGVILGAAKAKFYPGGRLSTLVLLSPEGRQAVRLGGGAVVHTTVPRLTIELDVFQAPTDESQAILATFGGAAYSDFLGRGKRRFLNPYLGMRLGYGYLDGSAFVFTAGGGVELFKHKNMMVDASVNFVGFVRKEFDAAVASSLSLVFAF